MALKDMLSKLSKISLKSKVGLAATAVLVGVLSWSAASKLFSSGEDPSRPPPRNNNTQASNSKSGDSDEAGKSAKAGEGEQSDDSVSKLAGASNLLKSLNHDGSPPPDETTTTPGNESQRYGNASSADTPQDRYSGYGYNNDTLASTQDSATANLGNTDGTDSGLQSKEGSTLDRVRAAATPDRYGSYRDSATEDAANEVSSRQTAGASSAQPGAQHDPFATGGYRTGDSTRDVATPGYGAGTALPQLDRSTPTLDRGAAPVSDNQIANNSSAFRSRSDQWNSGNTSQPTTSGGNQAQPPARMPVEQELYPRNSTANLNTAATVSAGGNRRMAPINSQPNPANVPNDAKAEGTVASAAHTELNSSAEPAIREFVAGTDDSFWTIARKAYGEGGYYEALHAYNSQAIVRIDALKVGDVVRAPTTQVLRERYPLQCPPERKINTQPATLPATPVRSANPGRERAELSAKSDALAMAETSADSAVLQTSGINAENDSANAELTIHVAKAGEDLFQIAREQLGSAARWAEIYELNKQSLGDNIDHLAEGTEIRLPPLRQLRAEGTSSDR